ncbi:hypothetical protein ACFL54_03500 [Planctomycetota bacterium]
MIAIKAISEAAIKAVSLDRSEPIWNLASSSPKSWLYGSCSRQCPAQKERLPLPGGARHYQ